MIMQKVYDQILIKEIIQKKEVQITVHYRQDGPTLEDCMSRVLAEHMNAKE